MTVTYTAEVATCRGFGCFLALLLRWKGSIYKLVWPDLFAFLTIYYTLNLSYRFVLNDAQRKTFEQVSEYCETYSNYIPLSFVLGFYISIIMTRWWDQYSTIPWPDPIAVYVSAHIHGQDERGRLMRRTIMRYVCLCLTMVFSMICPRVKKRFPTLEHLVDAGLMTENEKCIVVDLNDKFPRHSKHWLPIVWAASIVTRARKEGRIRDDFAVKTVIDELNVFRGKCGKLLNYDTISVPLVYTQVVTLATYSFFITSCIGRQWLDVDESSRLRSRANPIDLYFPVFTTLQFFFYMGWLKVAESLINPFGEDDDDFEINWIVDRNVSVFTDEEIRSLLNDLCSYNEDSITCVNDIDMRVDVVDISQVAYLIVDEMHHEHPELIKDQYWDQVFPTELPHTTESEPFKGKIPQPSTANIAANMADYTSPSSIKIDEMGRINDDNQSGIHFMAGRSSSMSGRHRTSSAGSQTSLTGYGSSQLGSTSATLQRVGSVTSVLKRIFSRTDNTNIGPVSVDGPMKMPESQSTTSLSSKVVSANIGGGSMRIADQVIEEVDEQATITSMAGRPPENRPTAQSIFANQMPASNPVDVPRGRIKATSHGDRSSATSLPPTMHISPARSMTNEMSIKSAPGFDNSSGLGSGSLGPQGDSMFEIGGLIEEADGQSNVQIIIDNYSEVSIGSSTEDEGEDEFQRLKEARRREMERIRMARSISVIAAGSRVPSPDNDEDIALLEMTVNSQTTLLPLDDK